MGVLDCIGLATVSFWMRDNADIIPKICSNDVPFNGAATGECAGVVIGLSGKTDVGQVANSPDTMLVGEELSNAPMNTSVVGVIVLSNAVTTGVELSIKPVTSPPVDIVVNDSNVP